MKKTIQSGLFSVSVLQYFVFTSSHKEEVKEGVQRLSSTLKDTTFEVDSFGEGVLELLGIRGRYEKEGGTRKSGSSPLPNGELHNHGTSDL